MKKENKQKYFYQKGLIKEIIIVIALIFILAYFNLDPEFLWQKIVDFYNYIVNLIF